MNSGGGVTRNAHDQLRDKTVYSTIIASIICFYSRSQNAIDGLILSELMDFRVWDKLTQRVNSYQAS